MKSDTFLSILNFSNFLYVYRCIKKNYKNKKMISRFKSFLNCNLTNLICKMQSTDFAFKKYNIFLIKEPKYRLIMSEDLDDKIINQVFSRFILIPYLSNSLIDSNVATRKNMGANKAYELTEKYLRRLTYENKEIYALKIDISKYFYNVDHKLLIEKVSKIIKDERCINFLKKILDTTDLDYINENINKIILEEKERINLLNISSKEKELKHNELDKLPRYKKGKGLPIGNLSSQILAIFYLNDLDHFIKEDLKIKYYVRYQDDFLLFHNSKQYLKDCLQNIDNFLQKEKLTLNSKTRIYKNTNNFLFLGRNKKGKYSRYRNVKRKLKSRLNLYNTGNISLNSFISSYVCYKDLCKRNFILHKKK